MNKVGIVILNYNNSAVTILTLESLLRSKCKVDTHLVLIDNNSHQNDQKNLEEYFVSQYAKNKSGTLIKNDYNHGYAGGNNLGIKNLIDRKDITHICLLNSDVIVTDYWLDRLLSVDADVVGPVTNAVGNEQTVPINFTVQKDLSSTSLVNEFAQKFYRTRANWVIYSNDLHFFATVMKKSVIVKVGLLDEDFYPGSFEDVDYCLRIKNEGLEMKIHRGVFIYHFGSASFEKLDDNIRLNIHNTNKSRLESKWSFEWEPDDPKLLLSYKQDVDFILNDKQKSIYGELLNDHYITLRNLLARLLKEKQELIIENQNILQTFDHPISIINLVKRCTKIYHFFIYFIRHPNYSRVLTNLLKARFGGKSIVVLSKYFNEDLLKDGYYRRIKLIDDLIVNHIRIYIYPEPNCPELNIHFNNDCSYEIGFDPNSKLQ